LSEVEEGLPIPLSKRAYFQARLRNRLYHLIIEKFVAAEKINGLTRAELARRIERRPEVITRLLGSPGNWTLETVSDLLLGISAEELMLECRSLLNRSPRNFSAPEWLEGATKSASVSGENSKSHYTSALEATTIATSNKLLQGDLGGRKKEDSRVATADTTLRHRSASAAAEQYDVNRR